MEFLKGIEVLDQSMIYNTVFQWNVGSIISICIIAVCIIGGLILAIKEEEGLLLGLGVAISVFLLIPLFGFGLQDVETGKYEYKVIISNEVNFNEFSEIYKVVKHEGKIYSIRINE